MPRVLGIELDTGFKVALAAVPGLPALALIGVLFVDVAFILVSIDQDFRGARTSLHVSIDNGIAEHWQYLKWGGLALALAYYAASQRAAIYVVWSLLFVYLLVDDSQQIHETYGVVIADALGLRPAFGLRAQDFGELIVTALAAVPLFGAITLIYLFAARREDRVFTHTMVALFVALAFFGVGIDMLDIMVPWRWLALTLNIVEDGGEMIVATIMAAYVTGSLIRACRLAADRDGMNGEAPPVSDRYSPASRRPRATAHP